MVLCRSLPLLHEKGLSLTNAAEEAADIVAGHDDTRLRVGRVVEELEPVLILQDGTKDTLFVAEEQEGNQAADGDTDLQRLAASKPSPHDGVDSGSGCAIQALGAGSKSQAAG